MCTTGDEAYCPKQIPTGFKCDGTFQRECQTASPRQVSMQVMVADDHHRVRCVRSGILDPYSRVSR